MPLWLGPLLKLNRLKLVGGAGVSQAAEASGNEDNVLVLDFTDLHFAATGHHGSAYVRIA